MLYLYAIYLYCLGGCRMLPGICQPLYIRLPYSITHASLLRLSSAGLIVIMIPWCCWACSALSV